MWIEKLRHWRAFPAVTAGDAAPVPVFHILMLGPHDPVPPYHDTDPGNSDAGEEAAVAGRAVAEPGL